MEAFYLIDEYLKSISGSHKSQKAVDNKRYILAGFLRFINEKPEEVNNKMLSDYEEHLKGRKLSHKNTLYYFRRIKDFFNFLISKKLLSSNPAAEYKKKFGCDNYSPEFKMYYGKYFSSENPKDKRALRRVLPIFFQFIQNKGRTEFKAITKDDLIEFKKVLKDKTVKLKSSLKKESVNVYLLALNRWFIWLKTQQGINESVSAEAERIFKKEKSRSGLLMKPEHLKLISEHISEKDSAEASSDKYYLKLFFKYITENNLELNKIRVSDVYNFQSFLMSEVKDNRSRFSTSSVRKVINAGNNFFKYLKKKHVIYSNPFYAVRLVKQAKSLPRNILKENEMSALLKELSRFMQCRNLNEAKALYKAHVIAEVLYSTGARIGEVSRMKVSDVDLSRGLVKIKDTKANYERFGILNEYAKEIIRIYIENLRQDLKHENNGNDEELLFYSGSNFERWFNKTVNKVSLKLALGEFKSHNMRHAVGFHLLRSGCDIRYIQEILGHKKLSSTQIYTKVDKEDLRGVLDKFHPRQLEALNHGELDEKFENALSLVS